MVLVLVERLGDNLGVLRWDLVNQPTLSEDLKEQHLKHLEC